MRKLAFGLLIGYGLAGPLGAQTPSPTAQGIRSASSPSPTTIVLPAPVAKPTLQLYIIQEGDTLWDLADTIYDDPWVWPLFLKFNGYPDPDRIYPGEALWFPSKEVLLAIKNKPPEEVKAIREEIIQKSAPVSLASLPPAAPTTVAPPATSKPKPSPTPVPPPIKTPTFKITGSKTINLSYSEAVGSSGNGLTNTGFDRHETLRLQMEGQLNDEVKLTGHFAQSDLALDDDYDLALSTKHWELFLGNFPATIPGSQFLSSNLSLTGLKLTGKYDDWNIAALYGTPRGRSIYEKFFGNNTQGPYQIPDVPLVPGTETVMVNKQKMVRGVDYNLDYTLGNLTFVTRIIQLTDLVEVEGQSRSSLYQTQVYGYRMEKVLAGALPGTTPGTSPSPSPSPSVMTSMGLSPSPSPSATVIFPKGLSAGFPVSILGGGATAVSGPTALNPLKGSWVVGQGYLRQFEQPDPSINTATGRAAADTHLFELDSTLDLGPPLKLSGEMDGSLYLSSDNSIAPSKEGAAYRAQGDTFQGPFHFQGKIAGTTPNFSSIGNPLQSGDYLEWTLLGDFKLGDSFFAQGDRTFQRTSALGSPDETTTDHAEARAKPAGFPEADYVYYQSNEVRSDPNAPFNQGTLRHTANLVFGIPGPMVLKTGGEYQSQTGTNLGVNESFGAKVELASQKWTKFNFSLSAEWKVNNIAEAGGNTLVPQATPGTGIPSQDYTYTMEGKPIDHLTLTGKGSYSNDPPGPEKANLTESYQTDPWPWLKSNGSYSLDFQQTQVLGSTTPDQVHTGSGSLDFTPMTWWKMSAQPTFRLDVLSLYSATISKNFHQNYRSNWTPDFGTLNAEYTLDQFWTWDASTAGFPLNFQQQTETWNLSARKPLGKFTEEVSYKRTDQNQQNINPSTSTSSETLNQVETDSIAWASSDFLTLTFTHSYTQLDQTAPGQGNITNPLLPNGPDSFNSTYTATPLNGSNYSHSFTLRMTEQWTKAFSCYEEGGYTHTVDLLQGGQVDTYSPGVGFTWKLGAALNWTGSYQYNGSSGEVATVIQKAQTALSMGLNQSTNLTMNWAWTRADDPFVENQQGTVAYSMNF